jgi:endonuclease YncB( thermonuclease family)
MQWKARIRGGLALVLVAVSLALAQAAAPQTPAGQPRGDQPAAKPQTRPHGQRVRVDPDAVTVEDGDGVIIQWSDKDTEIVRILGIDTPEIRRLEHNLPFDQPLGPEARAFAQGALAVATEIELLRAPMLDPFDRTLAYLFLNGRNFSVLVIRAGFSDETVSHYGDNGLPQEAALVKAAAKGTAPLVFEPPGQFRARMRELSSWLKQNGQFPKN